jgi:bifunctional DNA-binding transcriptional regulator/antitoxin component of YhaV-PrlF toxin-antitoxin module
VTTLKLHYDGWLALPAGLRHKLGLKSGGRLEAELVGGTVVLRPAAAVRRQAEPEATASAPPAAAAPAASSVEAATPGKGRPGRPRKVQLAEAGADRVPGLPEDAPLPTKRKPGRPCKVSHAEEPEPAAAPVSGAGEPWKLRRKAELPTANVGDDPAAAPARRPERVRFDTGYEREERHPFRQVEVRKLGPGRGHHRPRQRTLG